MSPIRSSDRTDYDVAGSPSEPRTHVASQESATVPDYRFTEFLPSCRATPFAFASCASPSTIAAKSASEPKFLAWTVMALSVCYDADVCHQRLEHAGKLVVSSGIG